MAKSLLLKKLIKLITSETDQEYKRQIQLVSRIKIETLLQIL